jgi:hypothetical protein
LAGVNSTDWLSSAILRITGWLIVFENVFDQPKLGEGGTEDQAEIYDFPS